jgi:hypothetical protein
MIEIKSVYKKDRSALHENHSKQKTPRPNLERFETDRGAIETELYGDY